MLCANAELLDLRDACVRGTWAAIPPTILVLTFCVVKFHPPLPAPVKRLVRAVKAPFKQFLTLREAEAFLVPGLDDIEVEETPQYDVPVWRPLLVVIGLAQCVVWIATAAFSFATEAPVWQGLRQLLLCGTWMYTIIRAATYMHATPPYDLFTLYAVYFVTAVIQLAGYCFEYYVDRVPLPGDIVVAGMVLNVASTLAVLLAVLQMPLDVPSSRTDVAQIGVTLSPESYTRLWQWITFSWVYPLIKKGTYTTLADKDVYQLSPNLQSRPVFIKFSNLKMPSLIQRLWVANSLDIILDFILTIVAVIFNYAGPFFLKRILDSIDKRAPTRRDTGTAYMYAGLMLLCAVAKAQVDLQHLWCGRRAATRVRVELIAAVYDKALKRQDYSGLIDKDKARAAAERKRNGAGTGAQTKAQKAAQKAADEKADDPKAGADTGKIVNLMAGDQTRVSTIVSGAYNIYGAPVEIIVGSSFLYALLGWSAFAGFVVLLVGWPLNSYIARRRVRMHKGELKARDARMSVVNELIGAVKFIKFFAWEERWIKRALDAREAEMKWMIKARLNSLMFFLIWALAPIGLSTISFLTYVMLGNELTVGTAFTAIALFGMIRSPLNVIPSWVVRFLQTRVSLNRIAVYLEEDEVTAQVSSLKQDLSIPFLEGAEDEGLGLENASLHWNALPDDDAEQRNVPGGKKHSPPSSIDDSATTLGDDSESEGGGNENNKFELRDISVVFPEGKLSVVTGPTASGKTALLMALLGEMTLLPGGRIIMSKQPSKIDEHGNMRGISYAAQSPWLRHQSIRDNILFGYPYDEARYKQVIECCALQPDLDVLEDGDATEIGARGVNLSGGQKARVALARAVYVRNKYVLLDDPLSAVDSHTARLLFDKLLLGPLLANRTVILVTHHVDLVLPGVHYLVRMLDGRIDTQGTIDDLRALGVLDDITHDAAVDAKTEEPVAAAEGELAPLDDPDPPKKGKPRKLVKDEHRAVGGVKWTIYNTYLKASSYWTWGFLLFAVLVGQLLSVGEKLWIKTWGSAYEHNATVYHSYQSFTSLNPEYPIDGAFNFAQIEPHLQTSSLFHVQWPSAIEHPLFYVGIYAAIGLTSAFVSFCAVAAQYTGALRASRLLFKQLLVSVVRATFRFHDTTPLGRMLNRFGLDMDKIDSDLAGDLQTVNSSLVGFFASVITITVVFPAFLFPAIVLGYIYYRLALGYLNTGRDLRRMESNSRSPIYSDFGELLEGIVTVRAFSAENRFLDNLHTRINTTTKMWYTFWMTNRWLLLNFDCLGGLAVFITALFSITFLNNDAGLAGLAMTSALNFTNAVYWACRNWTGLEVDLNSVERVVEYLKLPQEPPAVIESKRPPAYWPSSANHDALISVENLVVKYSPELPAVLQDISFTLKAGERIGLVGRTGSGKSTLAMSFLRFIDPVRGRIVIDGIDISTIGINDLRSRLTFIPQDATLFSGTLRDNLDPFSDYDDDACMDALYRVHLITDSPGASRGPSRGHSAATSPMSSRPPSVNGSSTDASLFTDVDSKTVITLDTQVSAGGTNFSQGQRQLIAMARALLRRSSVVVMDEATSSVDFKTDAKIQKTIREEFTESLLITVAHRLKTIIDYDRLVVLDHGKVVELDTPYRLLQREDGVFRGMCLKSGSFGELEAAARTKAEERAEMW